ncbi:MAG: GNAT family N-acetyltransferase [Phycisphaerales bacterium]
MPRPRATQTHSEATTRAVEVFASDAIGTVLETDRLLLRPALSADTKSLQSAIAALVATGETASGVFFPGEQVAAIVKRQLELTAKGVRTGCALRRAIFDRAAPDTILGCCNLTSIERGLEWYAELAFWIVPGARGLGFAHEACAAVVQHALEDLPQGLGVSSVRAYVQPDNDGAQRMLSGIGFDRRTTQCEHLSTGGQHLPHELWTKGVSA